MIQFLLLLILFTTTTNAYTTNFNIKTCTKQGCEIAQKRIALDVDSNYTSTSGEKLIQVAGEDMDELTLTYGGSVVGGPRVYLIEGDENENYMFDLLNNEFSFDVELQTLPCGFNAALYFVGMDKNSQGAENGTNYCDAQAVAGTFCSELDVLEANTQAQQYTTHACVDECGSFSDNAKCKGNGSPSNVCDQSGCGLNPFRYGEGTTYNQENNNLDWYGPNSKTLNSLQKFKVVTQFYSSGNDLVNITRFYLQNEKRIDLPTLYVKTPTDGQHMGAFTQPALREDFCTDIYDRWSSGTNGPLKQMGENLKNGMVLTMSAWYAQETYPLQGTQTGMSWLDGQNNWGKSIKAGPCDSTTTDAGDSHFATFSDLRVGPIGSTVVAPPSPTPPAPAPSPPPASNGNCCYNGCTNCQTGWCSQTQANCEGNCNGKWCPSI